MGGLNTPATLAETLYHVTYDPTGPSLTLDSSSVSVGGNYLSSLNSAGAGGVQTGSQLAIVKITTQ